MNNFRTISERYKMNETTKRLGTRPLFYTKRPLAGNLYCSPSPPLLLVLSRMLMVIHPMMGIQT